MTDKNIPDFVLSYLAATGKSMVEHSALVRQVGKKIKITKTDAAEIVYDLASDGTIARLCQGGELYYCPAGSLPRCMEGVVESKNAKGISVNCGGETGFYSVSPLLGFFMEGDRISFCASGSGNDAPGGEMIYAALLEPTERKIVCRVTRKKDGQIVLHPDNQKKYGDLVIYPVHELPSDMDSNLVAVSLVQRPLPPADLSLPVRGGVSYTLYGSVAEVFDSKDSMDVQIRRAIAEYSIPHEWPEAVKGQLKRISDEVQPAEKLGRRDLTALPLVTLDGDDARDFDDAVYAKPLDRPEGGWRLYVAIADVSYYVRRDSPLDQEAFRRGNSVYFPNYVVPMLPEKLSNGLCSLNPNVDRLCMTCEMVIDRGGRLESYEIYPAVMHSHARLTYSKVHRMLEGDAALAAEYESVYPDIVALYEMYKAMDSARKSRSVIEFGSEEMKFFFDENHKIEDMRFDERYESHKIIEECMIAANVATASFIVRHKYKTLFRIHPSPSEDKVTAFRNQISFYNLVLPGDSVPSQADYGRFLRSIEGRPDAEMLRIMMLRSLAKAVYSPENCGHYALALKNYAHFTSPIRRYPDLMLHRELKYLLAQEGRSGETCGDDLGGWHYDLAFLPGAGVHCSETERRAEDATNQVDAWLKCQFLMDRIGMTFPGYVTNVAPHGVFVRLEQWPIDGLVYVGNLGSDYFEVTSTGNAIVGANTGVMYRLGDRIDVVIDSIDTTSNRINFLLAENSRNLTYKKNRKSR